MLILDGKALAAQLTSELKARVLRLGFTPRLAIIQVGDDPASTKYINSKRRKAEEVGIEVVIKKVPSTITEIDLIKLVKKTQRDVTGLIVQLPLPIHINKQNVLNAVRFDKDVDGLAEGNSVMTPATPRGIMTLLRHYRVPLRNRVVAVVGQSKLVGMPVANLCAAAGAKVLRFTKETGISGTEAADVLIVAAGSANLIKKEHIKPGVVIVDVGINEIADKNAMRQIVGDVDRESVGNLPAAISPVPGGVGPMTVISLIENTVIAAEGFGNRRGRML